jgi:hypothetical protein
MVGKWCRPVYSVSMWWGWYQVTLWCTGTHTHNNTQQHTRCTRITRITHHTYIMPDTHTRLVPSDMCAIIYYWKEQSL